jgi:glycosyltransferase involved in cell wall biosynthesis
MTQPIRILELRSVRGTGGGPEKTILHGALGADRSAFEVTVCYLRDGRDAVFSVDTRAVSLGIDYLEVRERHSFDPAIFRELRRIVRERRIDIVHAHDYKTNLLAYLLGRIDRVRSLTTVHGWTGHTPRERWLYYPLDKRLLARFPRVIAVSSEIRDVLVRYGAKSARVSVLLNGIDHRGVRRDRGRVDHHRSRLGIKAGEFVIGAVGRLEPQKRFDLLIDAVARVRANRPEVRLLIVGEGSDRPVLQDAMRRHQLVEPYCRLLGHRADIIDLHHAFDLFVQSSDYEGTPNAVLEAMALETPIIATDVGGTRELLREQVDGLLVRPSDAAALADAIECVLADRAAAARRVSSARRRVERELSFDARMRALEAIYRELAQPSAIAGAQRKPVVTIGG